MSRKVIVTLKAPSELGKFNDEFDIVTKHEIYHIPIMAQVVSESQTRNDSLGFGMTRGVMEVEETPRKKNESSVLPRLK